ncbi:hypothetical protein ACFO0N_00740 [Halobium salinum]|uniref:Transmembrane protein n=1 Tax=Halobium salinum TaxID=1364940 RepID=A0ABD5P6U9_9EURY|nr:hypothetical protein [Halobium salinum]
MKRYAGFLLGVLGMAVTAGVAAPNVVAGGSVSHGVASGFLLSASAAFVGAAARPKLVPNGLSSVIRLSLPLALALVLVCAAVGASLAVPLGLTVALACGLLLLRGVRALRRLDVRRKRTPEHEVLSREEFTRAGFDD